VNEHVDSRAITYAVGASLALHAMLLALRAPESQPPPVPSVTITAHIAEPEAAPAPAVVEPQPVPAPPKVEKVKPPPRVVRPEPAPARPSPFTVAPAPVETPAPLVETAPAPAPAPAPGPVATAPAAPPAPDPSMLIAQFRSQFIGAAVRYKRYPLPARDNGWEGDVLVHLEITASGELGELKVKRSSGHAVLDEQALEMFRLAAPQVPVPPALRGRAFGFDVRAVYSLKD
jgi:protein TonB